MPPDALAHDIRSSQRFQVVGVNHRTLPVHERELLTKLERENEQLLKSLVESCSLEEAALLSTCNRFEVISVANSTAPGHSTGQIVEFLKKHLNHPLKAEAFYQFEDTEAIRHVFRVSSSLDSMVLGEAQILGQVKESYDRAVASGVAGKYLHHLFQSAFRLAKRVRSHTAVGEGGVSLSYVAVCLAGQIFEDLSNRSVLVIGGGQMAELAVLHLRARGCRSITIANRTLERAATLAARVDGSAVSLSEIERYVSDSDIIIGSLSIDRPILDRAQAKSLLGLKPQLLIDLGVPRNFSDVLGTIDNVYLYSVDDLSRISEENRQIRSEAAQDAELIVEHGLFQFQRWMVKVSSEPALIDFRKNVHQICTAELRRVFPGGNVEITEDLLAHLSHRVAQKVSHELSELISHAPQGKIDAEMLLPLLLADLMDRE